jgi:hypothetical protein
LSINLQSLAFAFRASNTAAAAARSQINTIWRRHLPLASSFTTTISAIHSLDIIRTCHPRGNGRNGLKSGGGRNPAAAVSDETLAMCG